MYAGVLLAFDQGTINEEGKGVRVTQNHADAVHMQHTGMLRAAGAGLAGTGCNRLLSASEPADDEDDEELPRAIPCTKNWRCPSCTCVSAILFMMLNDLIVSHCLPSCDIISLKQLCSTADALEICQHTVALSVLTNA